MSEPVEPLLRWIVLCPLLASVALALGVGFVRRGGSGRFASLVACSAVAGALGLAGLTYVELIRQPPDARRFVDWIGTWIGTGVGAERFTAELTLQLDPLTGLLALFVAGTALAIHVSAAGALWGERRAPRFFAALGFFTFAALLVSLAEDLVLLFLGWMSASLAQALLSGHHFDEPLAARGASANGVAQRIADAGFVFGLLFGFSALVAMGSGSLDVVTFASTLAETGRAGAPLGWTVPDAEVVSAGFVLAALARSGQGPFLFLWNRGLHGRFESMACVQGSLGSLLGLALLIRLAPLLDASPLVSTALLWLGAATALVASALAILQRDLVRALGLLLAGQLGFAFVALGVQAPVAALFHGLITAAVFALLFLCAGRIHGELRHTELDRMGALRIRLWHVHLLFAVGVFTLAGVPLSGGFFSRNEVLASVAASGVTASLPLVRVLFLAAFFNAFAALCVYFRIFWGDSRAAPRCGDLRPELDTWSATPLWALAAFAALGGILGLPQAFGDLAVVRIEDAHSLHNWLVSQPGLGASQPATRVVFGVAGVSVLGFALAFALARRVALTPPAFGASITQSVQRLRELGGSGQASTWFTDRAITRPLRAFATRIVDPFDRHVLDAGFVRGLPGVLTWISQEVVARAQTGRITFALLCVLIGTGAMVLWSLR